MRLCLKWCATMTKGLREIIKNIKNWQFDPSDSLIQLFSTRPCTSQDLDINFDASSSLSVGGDLINWFDDYSWRTNRAHLTPHMSASFSPVESVCLNFCLFSRRLQWDTWLLLWVTACLHGLFVYCSWYIFSQLQCFIYVLLVSLKWFTPSLMEVFLMSYTCISSCCQKHFENSLTKCIQ